MKILIRIYFGLRILVLLAGGLYGLVYLAAKESRDCRQMVVDGYEVRSGINIPAVAATSCYFDAERNMRVSVYELKVPVRQFIGSIKLTAVAEASPLKSSHLLSASELTANGELYAREGSKWGDQWQYVVDAKSGRLWVEVLFAD